MTTELQFFNRTFCVPQYRSHAWAISSNHSRLNNVGVIRLALLSHGGKVSCNDVLI